VVPSPAAGDQRLRLDPLLLRPLVRLAALVPEAHDTGALVEAAAETARELLEADSLALSRLNTAGTHIDTLINVGVLAPGEQRWPPDERYEVQHFAGSLGFLHGEATRRGWTHVDDDDAEPAERRLLLDTGRVTSLKAPIVVDGVMWGELWAARSQGRPAFDALDGDLAMVITGLVSAALAQVAAWESLDRLARTDALTGLANRRHCDEHLARHLAGDGPVSVALGDINGLKQVNDRIGHAAGDDALLHVAACAAAAVRELPGGLAVRLGGDEFALVLPGLDGVTALQVAGCWTLASAHDGYGTSLSCGVASTDGGIRDARLLLGAADAAQYRAKREGHPQPLLAA